MDYIEKIENGELFVLCLNTIEDGAGAYCIKGEEYEVIDYIDDEESGKCLLIGIDNCEMNCLQFKIDDSDFKIIIK